MAMRGPLLAIAIGCLWLCPSATANTLPADGPDGMPGLLDGRMWEMVSPPDKSGARVEALPASGATVQASADGEKVVYVAFGPIGEVEGNRTIEVTQIVSSRNAGGWSSQALTTPSEELTNLITEDIDEYRLFSEDDGFGVVEPKSETPLPPLGQGAEQTIYLRNSTNGEYTPLVTKGNVVAGTSFGGSIHFLGGTPDLSHVIVGSVDGLTAAEGLTPAALAMSEGQLYEWVGGKLHLVSVSPERKAVAGALGGRDINVRHAVSSDGQRIVWQEEGVGSEKPLNLRDMGREETVRIDTVQAGANGPAPGDNREEALFQTASSDGSRVFFTDESELTTNSHAQPNSSDLYVFEAPRGGALSAGTLTDLAVPLHGGESAGVQGAVLGAGEAGTDVYFVANGVLAPGPVEPGHCEEGARESASTAVCYLYVAKYDEVTKTWERPRYIATLANADEASWDPGWPKQLLGLTAEVSRNGKYVAFMSTRSLTGYDNEDIHSGASDLEVFVYDAENEDIACASCEPGGARPSGVFDEPDPKTPPLYDSSGNWLNQWVAGSIPGWNPLGVGLTYYQPRYLSDEGRLYFDSPDALVPAATNEREDVYEYEPDGVGGCGSGSGGPAVAVKVAHEFEAAGVKGDEGAGCVGLISSGASSQESVVMDASESGNDVFFLTDASLVPEDKDSAFDVYDAHVCGEQSPCIPPGAAPSSPCESAQSCRAPSSGTPVFSVPPSAAFSGAGNLAPQLKPETKMTRAQKLDRALEACRRNDRAAKRRRAACERSARKRYRARASRSRAARKESAR
jgi:hypothetical protein